MCRAFALVGTDVSLFVNNRDDVDTASIALYYKTDIPFALRRISSGFFSPRILPSFYTSEIYFALSFLLKTRKNEFDVIYSRHEWIIWFLSIFLSAKKLAWESHEAKYNFPARRLLKKGIRTVVISEGIFEDYITCGVPQEQLHIAHDGIDESFFGVVEDKMSVRKRLGLPEKATIAMYIGGFDAWKGIETFFAAASHCPSILFVAIGGSSEQVATLRQQYPAVTFLGQHPYAALKDNQQAADILVVPNSAKNDLSARYTSPLKLFAHMASAVPLVVSDIPSLVTVTGRDLVTPVAPDDVRALVEGVRDVFSHQDAKIQLARELKRVSVRYTWNQRAKGIINFINN